MAGDNTEDDDNLLSLLEGDEFVTEEERRKQEAERRRLERKRRLERLEAETGTTEPAVAAPRQENAVAVKHDPGINSVSPIVADGAMAKAATAGGNTAGGTQQDWDDSEGYYKAVIGEVITVDASKNNQSDGTASTTVAGGGDISFRVSGVIGKGVFSSVLKCTTISNSTSVMLPPVVAIKCIRHNETMAKAAFSEIQFLQRLKNSSGIVDLLLPTSTTPLDHRGHVLLVFPCADYNLRDVLQKFGKGVGLSLEAVRSYFHQLLGAANHLKKHAILHSDLKPDNILVSRDFNMVQLGDFGSAIDVSVSSQSQTPTPYLVSRFYRAPEVILGLVPTYAMDLWSLAVSVAEIFLGNVVFRGNTNNDMIYSFMQHLGPFSNRLIRQHLVQCQKMPIPPHFTQRKDGAGSDYLYMQHTVDPVTGKPVQKYISLFSGDQGSQDSQHEVFPSTPLSKKLLKAKSAKDSRTLVLRFADLLQKCLSLDPSRRISLRNALQHEFFAKGASSSSSAGGGGSNGKQKSS
ncbi:protein kinase PRP4 homolog [Seminavis robusta]|uniref:Protein kinase PRP4 homolog n=1 Tax=Seminavis robusta TaxID=568900 RepID=A0A9N8HV28_9STRA|nr:protein kinase PRP4 homolog [Seminavis robusta]|eukprot:Sro2224_g319730.1 protein kinase PRP4 homolog (518) ;mRNA; f:6703-8379